MERNRQRISPNFPWCGPDRERTETTRTMGSICSLLWGIPAIGKDTPRGGTGRDIAFYRFDGMSLAARACTASVSVISNALRLRRLRLH